MNIYHAFNPLIHRTTCIRKECSGLWCLEAMLLRHPLIL